MTTFRLHTELSDIFLKATYRNSHIKTSVRFYVFGPETFINFNS